MRQPSVCVYTRKPENFVHSGSTRKVCAWKARGEASYYDTLSRHYRFHIYIYSHAYRFSFLRSNPNRRAKKKTEEIAWRTWSPTRVETGGNCRSIRTSTSENQPAFFSSLFPRKIKVEEVKESKSINENRPVLFNYPFYLLEESIFPLFLFIFTINS